MRPFDGTTFIKKPDPEAMRKYEPLPEGEHLLICDGASIDDNAKGTLAEFVWLVGDTKRKVWDRMYLDGDGISEKAITIGCERFAKCLAAAGLEPKFSDRAEANKLCMKMVGAQVTAKTKNREYEGKIYTNVTSYKPVSKVKKVTLSGDGF